MLRAYRNCTLLFLGVKSPANCDAHLAESYFRTRLAEIFSFGKSVNDSIAANHNEQTIFYKLNEKNYYENENIT